MASDHGFSYLPPKMPSDCDPKDEISVILTISKFSPLGALPLFLFAGYILSLKSSKHLQPSKRAYGYFLISKLVSLVFVCSGFAPIIHTPAWGFQTTGFLQIFNAFNPFWAIIAPVYCHLVMLFFLVQVIRTRCGTIQRFAASACDKEKKMLVMVESLLKVLYFFILCSFWFPLLLLGFSEPEDQKRLREAAVKNKAKDIGCPLFIFMDTESWRLYISVVVLIFLLIFFLIFSAGYLSATYHVLKETKMRISKKVWKIQTGFLALIVVQIAILFIFLLFLPVVFLALKAPGTESVSLAILLVIGHYGTASTLVFIFAHRFVRSKIIKIINSCVPKQTRIGAAVEADGIDTSVPQIQVFAVISDTTTV